MKRYMVFTYTTYYPTGGMNDYVGSVDKKAEVVELVSKPPYNPWCNIFDTKTETTYDSLESFMEAGSDR